MPKLYMLVGIPGSGKSTWVSSQPWTKDCVYVSTDKHVEEYARSQGTTYSEVFDEYMSTAVSRMMEDVQKAREANKDIIWDQTNVSKKSRAKKLDVLYNYDAIAVYFNTPDRDTLRFRLDNRPGKTIPWRVITQMAGNLQEPTLDEGFAEIWQITTAEKAK